MKKCNDVTSLERSAMARIKGGGSIPAKCPGRWVCSGALDSVNKGNAEKKRQQEEAIKQEEDEEEKTEIED